MEINLGNLVQLIPIAVFGGAGITLIVIKPHGGAMMIFSLFNVPAGLRKTACWATTAAARKGSK